LFVFAVVSVFVFTVVSLCVFAVVSLFVIPEGDLRLPLFVPAFAVFFFLLSS
jgi:hypothetical protein